MVCVFMKIEKIAYNTHWKMWSESEYSICQKMAKQSINFVKSLLKDCTFEWTCNSLVTPINRPEYDKKKTSTSRHELCLFHVTLYRKYSGLNCRLYVKITVCPYFFFSAVVLQRICYLIFHLSIISCQKMHFTSSPHLTLMMLYAQCNIYNKFSPWFTLAGMFHVATDRLADTVVHTQTRERERKRKRVRERDREIESERDETREINE